MKKRRIIAAAITLFVLVAGAATIAFWGNHDYTDCQRHNYNNKLNGGVKEFDGKKYTINICGSGTNNSHFFGDSFDAVTLTITNEQGEVVAKRRYKVFWDGVPGHEPLTIDKNRIIYQDDEEQTDHTISMPPTTIEWIRARIPLLN
ncbi:hypothetical protein L0Z36_26220 [Burkholderia multivorans]|uniref:hypothetical protein n=1 Tax=Burkholderia multivorans TaxID=87883 RepID=UPI0020189325|nr:hypothetical protein [Burkholderia multivorans]UQP02915.1 hypothetical protein L0Z36_26220 [Burkholderia multivorans]